MSDINDRVKSTFGEAASMNWTQERANQYLPTKRHYHK